MRKPGFESCRQVLALSLVLCCLCPFGSRSIRNDRSATSGPVQQSLDSLRHNMDSRPLSRNRQQRPNHLGSGLWLSGCREPDSRHAGHALPDRFNYQNVCFDAADEMR